MNDEDPSLQKLTSACELLPEKEHQEYLLDLIRRREIAEMFHDDPNRARKMFARFRYDKSRTGREHQKDLKDVAERTASRYRGID